MKKQSLFVLFGLLAVAVILGCSQSGENAFENPVSGLNSTVSTPPPAPRESNPPAGKVRICHFIQPDDFGDICGTFDGGDSVVIEVSANAFPKNHATHSPIGGGIVDFITTADIGSCNCDD